MAALRRAGLACAVGALSLWAGTSSALAHGEFSPTIRTVIDGVSPTTPGVVFRVLTAGTARLSAVNHTRKELTVFAPTGQPFLRIGPKGVLANVHSLFWYLSGNPDGVGRLPAGVRGGSPPRWERASRRPQWAWFDHRLHPGTTPVPRSAARDRRVARLDDWNVPARLGDRNVRVSGHVEYRPSVGAIVPALTSGTDVTTAVQTSLLPGQVPGLFLVNGGRETVTVIGREGEPFARIGPRGVEVNLNSATHIDDRLAKGNAPGRERGLGSTPRWRRVDTTPRYAWLDSRAFFDPQRVNADVLRRGREVVLERWSVPLRIGKRTLSITGTASWVPGAEAAAVTGGAPGSERGGGVGVGLWPPLAVALFVAAVGGALTLRRRQRAAA